MKQHSKPKPNHAGDYSRTGLVRELQTGWGTYYGDGKSLNPLGALVVLSGYSENADFNADAYSRNLIVQDCTFINPSSPGLSLNWAKDVLVTNCTFRYFDSIPGSTSPNALWAWCGILALAPRMENVAVLNCAFHGNVAMTTNSTDYAGDGIWLGNGGQWVVEGCSLTNYQYEAVQFNAGPFTVVGNTFHTKSLCTASCATMAYHNSDDLALRSANNIYAAYSMVNNTVSGGNAGFQGPTGSTNFSAGAYAVMASANQFSMSWIDAAVLPIGVSLEYAQYATVTGNVATNCSQVRGLHHINALNRFPTNAALCGTNLTLLVQGNDFSPIEQGSFYSVDSGNKVKEAKFLYNKLGYLYSYHLHQELLPVDSANAPVFTVQGNQFYWNGSQTNNYSFMPVVTNWTAFPTNNNSGWNNSATNQYLINNPNQFADTNLFSLY